MPAPRPSPPRPASPLPVALLALLGAGALLAPGPVAAGDLSFSEDTGAEAAAPTTAWPDRVIVDATTWTLLAVWTTDPPAEQAVPLARIARFERARPWEGRPDELVAVLKDGSRLLVARGDGVVSATTLLGAVTGSKVVEVDPAGPWPAAARQDGKTPDTTLALGSVHTGAQVAATLGSADSSAGAAAAAQPRRAQSYDVHEPLPANTDPDALDAQAIQVAVKQQMSPIRQCYNRELQRDASLSGKVVVWFLIEADGGVSKVRLKETTMGNSIVEDCIVDQVATMTFPKPQAGKVVPVSFPFSFTGG
ncbi:AgmX/PglI C-terminal domain-containing protein [Myxococcota bacterium]|nr:AgmX/PglI C-terminal domain-containing protein [Myxococcota bacterium]